MSLLIKKWAIILLVSCNCLFANAQSQFDCASFLAKKVSTDPATILKECEHFLHCGIDSIDFENFVQPAILAPLIIKTTNEKGICTYGDILNDIMLASEQPEYQSFKETQKTIKQLGDVVVTDANWKENKPLLATFADEGNLKKMEALYKANPDKSWTYRELFTTYQELKESRE